MQVLPAFYAFLFQFLFKGAFFISSAFIKDILREIGKTKSRFFSIFAIIALGAGFFAGLKATCPDMLFTQEQYFRENNLMDIRLVSTLGFSEKDIEAIEKADEIKEIFPSYSKDVFVKNDSGANIIAKLMAFPDSGMNEVILLEGRLPEKPGECVAEKHSQMKAVHEIGDTVSVYTTDPEDPIENSLSRSEWEVVGIVMSPQYIGYDRGTSSIGDGSADTYIMIPAEDFSLDVFTEVYITLDSAEGLSPFGEEYSAAVDSAVAVLEKTAGERAPLRLSEIKAEAYSEINDGKREIEKAKKELSEAEKELSDALDKLLDGEKEISEGRAEYYSGLSEYESGLDEFEKGISQAKNELSEAEKKLSEGWAEYRKGYDEYSEGLSQFEEGLAASGMSAEELYPTRAMLQIALAFYKIIPGGEATAAELEAQLSLIDEAIAAHEQLLAAEKQLSEAREQLIAGEAELENGRALLLEEEASALKELSEAKKQLDFAFSMLSDAEKELSAGMAEYEEGLSVFLREKAKAEKEISDAEREIADAEEALSGIEEPEWYVLDRGGNPGYSSYESDAHIIESVGKVFPFFFFLVAMLVCLTTMTRMVEEQRTQTGTMKALGYKNSTVLLKYLAYSSFASISGSIFGIAVCSFVFPLIIYGAYAMRYIVPPLRFVPMPELWVGVVLVSVLCTGLAVVFAGYSELRSQPAELMRPKAPKAGKRVLLERIPFIWKRLSFTRKVTVRNLFRYKKRIFMTILGIAGCCALILTGFGISSSVSVVFDKQYNEIFRYDLIVSLDSDSGSEKTSEVLSALDENGLVEKSLPAYFMSASFEESRNISLVVTDDPASFGEMILFRNPDSGEKISLDDSGVIITAGLSESYGLSAGDSMTFFCDGTKLSVKISGVAENYTMHFIYMTENLYSSVTGGIPPVNCVFSVMTDTDEKSRDILGTELLGCGGVLAVTFSAVSMESLRSVVDNLNYVVILIIVCAAALAFVVLYNLTNINITERIREIATIKVLGFYDREVSQYVFRENIILSVIGAFAGLFLGTRLHSFVMKTIQTDDVVFGSVIPPMAFVLAFAVTILFSVLINRLMSFRLKKISMVESLKSVE